MRTPAEDGLFLGLGIRQNRAARMLLLTQRHYTEDVLERFNHSDATPVDNPSEGWVTLQREASGAG